MKVKRNIFSFVLTAIVFIIFYYSIDTKQFVKIYSNYSLKTIIVAIILYGFSYIFRGIRFKLLINSKSITIKQLLPIVYIHGFYNRLLPARSGELSFVYFMKKDLKVEIDKSFFSLFYARIFDLFTMLLLFFIAIPFVVKELDNFIMIVTLSFILFIILLFILFFLPHILLFLYKIFAKLEAKKSNKLIIKIKDNLKNIILYNSKINKVKIIKIIFISLINWISIFSMFFVLLKSTKLNFLEIVFGSTFANLTNVLPLSAIGGFGTMEAGWTIGFTLIGLDYQTALTTGIVVNVFAFLTITIFGCIGLIFNKIINKMGVKNEINNTNPML